MARTLADGVWELDLGLVPPFASNAFLVDEAESNHEGTGSSDDAGSSNDAGSSDHGENGGRGDDGEVTLIDAGLRWNRPSIRDELADVGYGPADLDRVLITHYDLDHVGGLDRLLPEFSGPVYLGRPDYDLLEYDEHPSPVHHKGLFHRLARRLFPLPGGLDVHPVSDGQRIGSFTVYATPGHNPGHSVYLLNAGDADSAAFLGDLVWEDDGGLTPPFWLDSYDMHELRESIRDLAERAPEFEIAAMGHGDPIESRGSEALCELTDQM